LRITDEPITLEQMEMIPHEELGSKPAPGHLALVQAFLNTVDLETGVDALDSPGALAAWFTRHGLLDPGVPLTDADLRFAIQVREALRGLAFANHDGERDPADLDVLNRAASGARLRVRFEEEGSALEADPPGIDGAIARLLGIVHDAMAEGVWDRFKACRRDTCRWAYYDRSRNRSSSWCTMDVCGNKEKARAYRERKKAEA